MQLIPPSTTPPILNKFVQIYKTWRKYWQHFPKEYRLSLGLKIDQLFLEIAELLFVASFLSKEEKLPYLAKAIRRLDVLRFMLQISWESKALDDKKYIYISELLNGVGSNLGGWHRQTMRDGKKTSA